MEGMKPVMVLRTMFNVDAQWMTLGYWLTWLGHDCYGSPKAVKWSYWKSLKILIIEEKYDQTIEEIMNEKSITPNAKRQWT